MDALLTAMTDAERAAVLLDPRVVSAVRRAARDLEMRRTYGAHRAAGASVTVAVESTATAFGVSDERVRSVVYGKTRRTRRARR